MPIDERACDEVRGELAALLYEEESAAGEGPERASLERHVAGCDACRAELEEMRAARALLSRWEVPEPQEDPAALAAEVVGEVRRAESRSRRPRLWLPRLAGAAAAVLLVVFMAAGTRVEVGGGAIAITMRLPWVEADAGLSRGVPDWSGWDERARAIAADQVAGLAADLATERVHLVRAIDRARARDQELFTSLLGAVGRETAQQNLATRGALIDLAGVVARQTPESRTERR